MDPLGSKLEYRHHDQKQQEDYLEVASPLLPTSPTGGAHMNPLLGRATLPLNSPMSRLDAMEKFSRRQSLQQQPQQPEIQTLQQPNRFNTRPASSTLTTTPDAIAALAASNTAREAQRQHDLNNRGDQHPVLRMFARMYPERKIIAMGLFALMVASLCTLAIPLLVGKVVDLVGTPGTTLVDIRALLLMALVVIIINGVGNFVNMYLLWKTGDKIVAQLRMDLFRSLIFRELSFFDHTRVGDLLSRLQNDVSALNTALTVDVAEFVQRVVIVVGAFSYMIYLSWDLTLITLLVAPCIGISGHHLARKFHNLQKTANDAMADANHIASETFLNLRTCRVLSLEFSRQQMYNEQVVKTYKLSLIQKLMKATQRTFVYFMGGIAVIGVLFYGGYKVIEKSLTAGDLLTFVLFGVQVGQQLGSCLDNVTLISIAAGASESVLDLVRQGQTNTPLYDEFKHLTPYHENINDRDLDEYVKQLEQDEVMRQRKQPPLHNNNNNINPTLQNLEDVPYDNILYCRNPHTIPVLERPDLSQDIVFKNIFFAYPTRPEAIVLRNLNLTIPYGTSVACISLSGGGKSSALSLLEKMYEPLSGEITIGGKNINDINTVAYRAQVAYVEQSPQLFNQSILGNILMSVNAYKLHDCEHTLQKIQEFVKDNGYNPYDEYDYQPITGYRSSSLSSSSITKTTRNETSQQQYDYNFTDHDDDNNAQLDTLHDPLFHPPQRDAQSDSNNANITNSHHTSSSSQNNNNKKNHNNNNNNAYTCPCQFRSDILLCQDLFGKTYTMMDVITAAKIAHAHHFITEFPAGYATKVGDKSNLSGGQQQRIAIARAALIHKSQIAILDESTSALDVESEKYIVDALKKISRNKTTITICHRLATSVHCDQLFFFLNGQVVEHGTHTELLERGGHYAKLWKLQEIEQQEEAQAKLELEQQLLQQ